jgi:hypothetical protein
MRVDNRVENGDQSGAFACHELAGHGGARSRKFRQRTPKAPGGREVAPAERGFLGELTVWAEFYEGDLEAPPLVHEQL